MFKNMMMFAEGDTPPVEPVTPPVTEPTVEPGTVPATEPVTPDAPVEPAGDPNADKISALQNSLDAALEAMARGDEPKPADPVPAEPTPEPTPAPVPATPVAAPTGDEAWKTELKRIQDEHAAFQSNTMKELEGMKLKDEMIGLTSEIQASISQYPNADVDRILAEIESGSDLSVPMIAKNLHEAHQTLVDKISKEQEEKIRTALSKENEGKIKVPQSSGTSSAPTDTSNSPLQSKATQDAAWANATKEAKANIL